MSALSVLFYEELNRSVMQVHQGNFTLEIVQGDITKQPDMEAVVNAANAQLMPGGGVAGAIHRAAGPELVEACRPLAPIRPGQAVITPGFRLPNRYVIHVLGPVYGRDVPSDQILAEAYRNALKLVDARGVHSVAFPAISTGAFGYPMEEAAQVALKTVLEEAPRLRHVRHVRFVLLDEHARKMHELVLIRLQTSG